MRDHVEGGAVMNTAPEGTRYKISTLPPTLATNEITNLLNRGAFGQRALSGRARVVLVLTSNCS